MSHRRSPLSDLIAPRNPSWVTIHDMPVPMRFDREHTALPIRLSDASCLKRMGVKGAKAQAWLTGQGIDVPPDVNSWVRTAEGTLVARLARSEFFLEDGPGGGAVDQLKQVLAPSSGVSPVTRQDGALIVHGTRVHELFAQTCNVNFKTWAINDCTVVMTSMVGVSVLALWEPLHELPRYRLWCDYTFAPYLWETLLDIARELGGDAVGLPALMPEVTALVASPSAAARLPQGTGSSTTKE